MKQVWLVGMIWVAGCTADVDVVEVKVDDVDTQAIEATEVQHTPSSYSTTGYQSVSAGEYHTLALRNDGRVYAAGKNANGELGNGTQTPTYEGTPTQVVGLSGVTAVAAGCDHSLALKSTGEVWGWGYNNRGQLGATGLTRQLTPVKVPGLPAMKAIAVGCAHSMGLDMNGYVWTWGYNLYGQAGNGTAGTTSAPYRITSFVASAIDAGESFSLALRTDGTVMAWGNNTYGQLARGNTTSSTLPVATLLTGISGISAGANHGMAIKNGADIVAWGSNAQGAIGAGSTTSTVSSPVIVGHGYWWGLGSGFFSAGRSFNLVATGDGFGPPLPGWTLFDWGANSYGQLGIGTTTSTPQIVSGGRYSNNSFDMVFVGSGYEGQLLVSAGGYHSAAIDNNGQVVAWGRNLFGQLGNGTTSDATWARVTLFP